MNLSLCKFCLILLTLLSSLIVWTFRAFATSSDFSEYPESRKVIVSELKARNGEMRKCSGRKRCAYLIVRSEFLLNRLETLDNGTDPLESLKRKYGKTAYDYVTENKDLIELKFDEHFTEQILRRTGWKMLSEDNGFTKAEMRRIYEDYVTEEALPELSKDMRKSKSRKMKAFYAYGVQYLLSDVRLESPMK